MRKTIVNCKLIGEEITTCEDSYKYYVEVLEFQIVSTETILADASLIRDQLFAGEQYIFFLTKWGYPSW